MFANTFQNGFISILYSCGSNPLLIWSTKVKNGHVRRVIDDEIKSLVLEVAGTNVATTYIACPIKARSSLGIKLPFLVMIIKNLKKYFSFEIQILDDKGMHRRFRISNFQSTTKVLPFCTTMPIKLSSGWNQVQLNLADFTKRAYGSTYLETKRIQIHANVRIRRIYFSDMLYEDHELPKEFRLCRPRGEAPLDRPSTEKRASDEQLEGLKTSKDQLEEIPSGALPSPVLEGEMKPGSQDELGQIVRYLSGDQLEQAEVEKPAAQVQVETEEYVLSIEEDLEEEPTAEEAPVDEDEGEEEGVTEDVAVVTEASAEPTEAAEGTEAAEPAAEAAEATEPAAEDNPAEEAEAAPGEAPPADEEAAAEPPAEP